MNKDEKITRAKEMTVESLIDSLAYNAKLHAVSGTDLTLMREAFENIEVFRAEIITRTKK